MMSPGAGRGLRLLVDGVALGLEEVEAVLDVVGVALQAGDVVERFLDGALAVEDVGGERRDGGIGLAALGRAMLGRDRHADQLGRRRRSVGRGRRRGSRQR